MRSALVGLCSSGLFGCAHGPAPEPAREPRQIESEPCDEGIFERASGELSSYLELENQRLRADLEQAEAAMVAIESGMRNQQTRADAVSALAEARIAVERATDTVPWRPDRAAEAARKLDEAERELKLDHLGTTVFFASRARRIADTLNAEALRVAEASETRFIRARRVNLRAGPSTETAILGVLSNQTPVFPERPEGEWLLVRTLAGQVGWVHAGLLESAQN